MKWRSVLLYRQYHGLVLLCIRYFMCDAFCTCRMPTPRGGNVRLLTIDYLFCFRKGGVAIDCVELTTMVHRPWRKSTQCKHQMQRTIDGRRRWQALCIQPEQQYADLWLALPAEGSNYTHGQHGELASLATDMNGPALAWPTQHTPSPLHVPIFPSSVLALKKGEEPAFCK